MNGVSDRIQRDTALEQRICREYRRVLQLSDVSADDDFLALGGNSIAAAALVAALDIPGFSTDMLFRYGTPKRIADALRRESADPDEENEACLKQAFPLTAYQTYMLDYQFSDAYSNMNNLPLLLEFDPALVRGETLQKAVAQMLLAHPVFGTVICADASGQFVQNYDESRIRTTEIIRLDDEAFERLKPTLVRPFPVFDHLLYRHTIYQTESRLFLFLDICHIVSDGTAMKIFIANLIRSLHGETLKKDHYYLYLRQAFQNAQSREDEVRRFYALCYPPMAFSSVPRRDLCLCKGKRISASRRCAFADFYRDGNATVGERLLLAALAALSEYNQERSVMANWVYHGRTTNLRQSIVGLLLTNLPVAVSFDSGKDTNTLLAEIRRQICTGIEYEWASMGTLDSRPMDNDKLTVYYQHEVFDYVQDPMLVRSQILFDEINGIVNSFNVFAGDSGDGLSIRFIGNSAFYSQQSMETFADLFVKHLIQSEPKEN